MIPILILFLCYDFILTHKIKDGGHRIDQKFCRNRGKSHFWTKPPRNLCDTTFKSNLTVRIPILILFLCRALTLILKINGGCLPTDKKKSLFFINNIPYG